MPKCLIAIDDAGDPGFKIGQGSTVFFVVAAVIFDDETDACEALQRIEQLRHNLGWHDMHEFKFRKTNSTIRKRFFETVKSLRFQAIIAIVDKRNIADTEMLRNPSRFYNSTILSVLRTGSFMKEAQITIDGEKGNNYRSRVKAYFRQNLPKFSVKNLDYKDSRKDALLQFADMIAGAALLTTKKRNDSIDYLSLIEEKTTIINS